jgi:hypothetical protein
LNNAPNRAPWNFLSKSFDTSPCAHARIAAHRRENAIPAISLKLNFVARSLPLPSNKDPAGINAILAVMDPSIAHSTELKKIHDHLVEQARTNVEN